MKTFVTLALTLVLAAAMLVGCGCTNRNTDNTSAPTVLPTNEELWNTTESTTRATTESTTAPMTTDGTETTTNGNGGNGIMDNTTETGGIMEGSNGTADVTEGPMSRSARRMMPGGR